MTERRPRVVVTRAAHQAGGLVAALDGAGFDVVAVPVIAIESGDPVPSDLSEYDWVAFTSVNAVDAVIAGGASLAGVRVAAVGPGTEAALRARGTYPDLVAPVSSAEGLADAFPPGPGRVLLPQSAIAPPLLRDVLLAKGWSVDVVAAYRTAPARVPVEHQQACQSADAVAFTSASTVRHYVDALGSGCVPPVVVCIGPSTAATAQRLGLSVNAVADPHTIDGLVAAVERALREPIERLRPSNTT